MERTIEFRRLDGEKVSVGPDVLGRLRGGFRGELLAAGDPGYDEARSLWNAMIDRRPALVARCTGTADVVQAVRFAGENDLLVSVRGGGHNIAGLAVAEGGLMIDMSRMRGVWVDPERRVARAQAGCTLGDVDRETQVHGLAAVLGFVSETGIAGLTVGGGFGYMSRRCGWTCDNLVSMEVVTADGRIVRASAESEPDLFWALRGGGGNFGVVTSFEYVLHPCGPEVLAGAIAWPGEDAPELMRLYREVVTSAPRELSTVIGLRIAPPAPWLPKEIHGKQMVVVFVCHTGRPEEGEKLIAPLRAFRKPVADIVALRPYTQMQTLLDATVPRGRRYYWKSEYMPSLEDGAIDTLIEHAQVIKSPLSAILMFHLDGAVNELPPGHSPAGNRDARFILNIAGSWPSPEQDEVNVKWARDCWQAMRPYSTGGVYLNFLTEDEGRDRTEAAYGKENLARLAALKKKYDPKNLFRHTKQVV